ncbi:MAG TPA: M24 family metallopeptidase [Nitrolancea sp.]|nr:M24 family metallopeptidase [Nitrolancea sp.]
MSTSPDAAMGRLENHYRKASPQEFKRRHELLYKLMAQKGLDGVIVYGGYKEMYQANARWLTGMREAMQFYAFFPARGEPTAWNALFPHLIAAQRMSAIPDTRWGGPSIAEAVAGRIKELGLRHGKIGLVGVHSARGITLPMDHWLIWQDELPHVEFVNVTRDIEDMQLVKSDEELQFYAKGAEYTDYTMAELIKAIEPGVDEVTLFGRMIIAAHEIGGQLDFALLGSTPMANPDMPYPWHVPTERVLAQGDIVLNEISTNYAGCSGQLIVPISLGEPTPEYRELYDIAAESLERARLVLRPGATQDDILEAARPITDAGLTSQASFIHGWPNPPMRPAVRLGERGAAEGRDQFVLQENMMIMIEPNPTTPDKKRGIFLGALHVVTPEGGRNLHKYPLAFVRR